MKIILNGFIAESVPNACFSFYHNYQLSKAFCSKLARRIHAKTWLDVVPASEQSTLKALIDGEDAPIRFVKKLNLHGYGYVYVAKSGRKLSIVGDFPVKSLPAPKCALTVGNYNVYPCELKNGVITCLVYNPVLNKGGLTKYYNTLSGSFFATARKLEIQKFFEKDDVALEPPVKMDKFWKPFFDALQEPVEVENADSEESPADEETTVSNSKEDLNAASEEVAPDVNVEAQSAITNEVLDDMAKPVAPETETKSAEPKKRGRKPKSEVNA